MSFLILGALVSCKGEPARSYCEATCDWAVTCAGTERTVDGAALADACLADTRASDPGCAKQEEGKLDPVSRKAVEACTGEIDAAMAAGECEGFVGSYDQIATALPPEDCAAQGTDFVATYDAAVQATTETGEQLCQRFTDTFCQRTEECVLGDFANDIPQQAIDELGTPFELCVARLDPEFTSACKGDDFYAAEESRTSEPNAPRQFARECVRDFSSISCEALFAGDLSETCAGAFTTPQQAAAVATALYGVSQDFAEYAP